MKPSSKILRNGKPRKGRDLMEVKRTNEQKTKASKLIGELGRTYNLQGKKLDVQENNTATITFESHHTLSSGAGADVLTSYGNVSYTCTLQVDLNGENWPVVRYTISTADSTIKRQKRSWLLSVHDATWMNCLGIDQKRAGKTDQALTDNERRSCCTLKFFPVNAPCSQFLSIPVYQRKYPVVNGFL